MVDKLTPERRSWNMSRIRGLNTKPERTLRSALHRLGYRFRLHRGDLPGKPDIVLVRYRLAIFVHGCFWHRHGCSYTYTPKSRQEFWQRKFTGNSDRDRRNRQALKKLHWRVFVVWECEIKDKRNLAKKLENIIKEARKIELLHRKTKLKREDVEL